MPGTDHVSNEYFFEGNGNNNIKEEIFAIYRADNEEKKFFLNLSFWQKIMKAIWT